MTGKMVNRINLKLFIMALGLLLSINGVIYMNGFIDADKEIAVLLIVMGIVLSFTGAVIPIPSERRAIYMGAPQSVSRTEKADETSTLKQVELLCPKCGAPVTGETIFCTNCGRRITPEKGHA